jgi:hypothetical protein
VGETLLRVRRPTLVCVWAMGRLAHNGIDAVGGWQGLKPPFIASAYRHD